MPPQPDPIQVEDQLDRRIRKPVDLLRCIVSCTEIVILAVAGVAASATTTGVETDIVGTTARLPHALLTIAPKVALFALLILPVALAVFQLVRRQPRRLVEAIATGVLAAGVAGAANIVLSRAAAAPLYDAIIMSRPGVSHVAALDPYLAGLVAYATMIVLIGRPHWRNALWTAIIVYAVVHVGAYHTTVLSLLITLLLGLGHRPGRAVRGRLGVAAAPGQGHRGGAVGRGPRGDRDPAGTPGQLRGARIPLLRGHHGAGRSPRRRRL